MKNLKIRSKLLVLVILLLIGIVAIGVSSIRFMGQINESSTIIAQNWLPSVIVAEELNTNTSDYRIKEYAHIIATDNSVMAEREQELEAINAEIDSLFNQYDGIITNETDRKLIQEAKAAWTEYMAMHDQMIQLSKDNLTTEAIAMVQGEAETLFNEASAIFLELVEFNKTGGDTASKEADELFVTSQRLLVICIIALAVIAIFCSMYIIRSITKPVAEIDSVARMIAAGKLDESINYKSKDELGVLATNFNTTVTRLRDYVNYIDEISAVLNEIANGNLVFQLTYDYAGEFAKVKDALNHISDSLNDTLGQINQSSDQVSNGSDQVASGAQALSQGATEQASSVEELAATINEISGQINETAQNAESASEKAGAVGMEVAESNNRMQDMLSAMSDISEGSSEIGKIIKTIEDIAFQTNILALNAAVEAARAGAAGKGFAVVADEVRNLASKSAEASKSTASLIESSLKSVENGAKIADETAQSLNLVVEGVKEVAGTINKISEASKEQAASIGQVTTGVDQISSVVQTNAATAEESAAASEELSGQATILKDLVSRFKLKQAGSGGME